MIGISTVFTALVVLIGLVTLMGRVLSPQEPAPEPNPAQAAGDSQREMASGQKEESEVEAAATPETDFNQIALSAYAYHRRATTRVKSDEPSTSWQMAGRIRELNQRRESN